MSMTYKFGSVRVQLDIPSEFAEVGQHCDAYLLPFFESVENESGADYVVKVISAIDLSEERELLKSKGNPVDIDKSGGFLRCHGYYIQTGAIRDVWMEPFGVHAKIDTEKKQVTIWGKDTERLKIPVVRVIEDIVSDLLEKLGAVLIHSSGVTVNGSAVLCVGNKGAGKTTSLVRMLRDFESRKLCNDLSVFMDVDNGVNVRGWPSYFKVEVGTISETEELAELFPYTSVDLLGKDELWSVYGKVPVFPSRVGRYFSRENDPEAPLQVIVFPTFDEDQPVGLTEIGLEEALEAIPDYVQGSLHPNHPDWMGLGNVAPERLVENARSFLKSKSELQFYKLSWAPSLTSLLSRIPALGASRSSRIQCKTWAADISLPRIVAPQCKET